MSRLLRPGSFVLAALLVGLAACGTSGGSSPGSGSGGSPGSTGADGTGTLSIEREQDAAVTKTIGIDGGSITAEAADGSTFELTVPEGALPGDTEITATPAELGGTDVATSTVMFEPSGLFFYEFAKLRITPSDPVPTGRQLFFSIADDGSSITAAPVDPKDRSTTVLVGHFSGYGLANATDPQRAALLARLADGAEARISSRLADAIGELRNQPPGSKGKTFDDLFDEAAAEYLRDVVRPRLKAAGGSCAATEKAVQTALGFERQLELVGKSGDYDFSGMDVLRQGLTATDSPCEKEAIAACKKAKDPSILQQFYLGRERQRQLIGMSEGGMSIPDIIEKSKRICLGRAYTATGGGSGLTASGEIADITQPFSLEGTFPGGSATLTYTPNGTDWRAGRYESQFSGSGVTGSTKGTYTIEGEEGKVLTLTGNSDGCVDGIPGSCRATTEVFTLTPA